MWPAHVSFPVDSTLIDTQGDGSSLTHPLFQLRPMGYLRFPTMNVAAAALEEMRNSCLKTMANSGLRV